MDELKQKEEKLFKDARKKALTVEKSNKGYMIIEPWQGMITALRWTT